MIARGFLNRVNARRCTNFVNGLLLTYLTQRIDQLGVKGGELI